MEKTYFILVQTDNSQKNKLDKMLHEAFKKYPGNLISETNLEIIDQEHEFVVDQYRMAGGKAVPYRYSRLKQGHGNETIHINISESLSLTLKPVIGQITPF